MKLTFFLGGLSGGGAERVVCNLSNYLVSRGHEIDIITMGDDSNYGLDNRIHRITLLYKQERKNVCLDSVKRLSRFVKYLRYKRRDAFVVMLPATTILLLRFRFLVKGKIIASERSYPTNYSIKDQRQLKRLAKRADSWVFQTKETQQWYQPYLGNTNSIIIPNPLNDAFVKPIYVGERKTMIITAGRLNKVKNHRLLLRAFSRIYKEYPDYSLVIYGEGALKKDLVLEAEHLGIIDKVSFPGFADWGELSKDASMFILSSNLEGMPNALMEAMALGMPCISTDCDGGGARFLIEDGVNGLLVPKNDVEAMATAMAKLLSNSDWANHLGAEAHKICERLAPEKIYKEWEDYLYQVAFSNKNI